MSSCCPPFSWDAPLEISDNPNAKIKGSIDFIGAYQTPVYYSAPDTVSTKGIIIFTDIWGFSQRLKIICDTFATHGYHVIMPDCFRGETKATQPDVFKWLKRFPYDPSVSRDVGACIEHLKSKGVDMKNIAAIGFCWGAWVIAKSASEGITWKCAVGAHPSTKIERVVFNNDEDAMMRNVGMPYLLLPAGNDEENTKPGSDMVRNLEMNGGGSILFEKMIHGWVTRGDLSDEEVKKDVEAALDHTLKFFLEHL